MGDRRGIEALEGDGAVIAPRQGGDALAKTRDHFRFRQHLNETVSLADQRQLFEECWVEVCALLQAA